MTSERITFALYLNLIMAVSLVAPAICATHASPFSGQKEVWPAS